MDQRAMPPNCLEPRLDCLAISFLGQVKELLVRRGFTMDHAARASALLLFYGYWGAFAWYTVSMARRGTALSSNNIIDRANRGVLHLMDLVERHVLVGDGPSESQLQAAWLLPYLTVAYYLTTRQLPDPEKPSTLFAMGLATPWAVLAWWGHAAHRRAYEERMKREAMDRGDSEAVAFWELKWWQRFDYLESLEQKL
ncbi:hypothetical protein CPLU01_07703 [Colletotrichum plurivorum]|uniref:Uncharacterized protein n=1 Tax=Colletotrichum plurivorum TaxID=2175906 RepID=A0A8H6KE99_9PEZI|nr:hypothetical protein CPLU01_07703 [Colletotrichum plurivorum]